MEDIKSDENWIILDKQSDCIDFAVKAKVLTPAIIDDIAAYLEKQPQKKAYIDICCYGLCDDVTYYKQNQELMDLLRTRDIDIRIEY